MTTLFDTVIGQLSEDVIKSHVADLQAQLERLLPTSEALYDLYLDCMAVIVTAPWAEEKERGKAMMRAAYLALPGRFVLEQIVKDKEGHDGRVFNRVQQWRKEWENYVQQC